MPRSGRLTNPPSPVACLVAVAIFGIGLAHGGYGNLAVAIMVVVVWAATALAVWRWGPPAGRASMLALGGLLALAALSGLSMAWANDAGRAFQATERDAAYLGLLAFGLVVMPRTGVRPWLEGLAAGIAALGFVALASRAAPGLFGGGDQALYGDLPSAAGRLSYPIGYWNGLASLLALGLVLLVYVGAASSSRASRLAAIAAMPALWLAIYLTSSRGGVIAALVGCGAAILLSPQRATRALAGAAGVVGGVLLVWISHRNGDFLRGADTAGAHRFGALVLVAAAVVGAAAAFVSTRPIDLARLVSRLRLRTSWAIGAAAVAAVVALLAVNPTARISEFERPDFSAPGAGGASHLVSAGGSGRYQFWKVALDAWGSSPVHGVGAGNYELYWNLHPDGPVAIRNAHSLYLETLAELGPLGLAALLVLCVGAPALALRRSSRSDARAAAAGLLAAGLVSAAVDWTWQIPAVFAPVILGIAVLHASEPPTGEPAAGGPARRWLLAALALAGTAALWSGVASAVSEVSLSASRAAYAKGALAGASSDANVAAGLEPFSPEPQLQIAQVDLAARQFGPATAAARHAIDLASDDWRTWLVAFEVAVARGDHQTAGADSAEMLRLIPVSTKARPNAGD